MKAGIGRIGGGPPEDAEGVKGEAGRARHIPTTILPKAAALPMWEKASRTPASEKSKRLSITGCSFACAMARSMASSASFGTTEIGRESGRVRVGQYG